MAKENPAIKPRPQLTFGQWILALVFAAIILFGLHLAGVINLPFFNTSNSGFGKINATHTQPTAAPYSHDFSNELAPAAGQPPYTYYIGPETSALPAGLVLGADGVLHGILTGKGGDVQICAKDAYGNKNCETIKLDVQDDIVQESQDVPTADVPYEYDFSDELAPEAGQPPYTYYVAPETPLPAGLTLTTAGVLSGTPTVKGVSNFQVCAKDAGNNQNCKTVKLDVQDNIPWKIHPEPTVGVPYNGDFSNMMLPLLEAQGGDCHFPCTYYLGSGVGFPPMGLFLDSFTGELKGTPRTENGGKFQVCLKDVSGRSVCRIFIMDIKPAVPAAGTVNPSTCPKHSCDTLMGCCGSVRGSEETGIVQENDELPFSIPTPQTVVANVLVEQSCDCPSDTFVALDQEGPWRPWKLCECNWNR